MTTGEPEIDPHGSDIARFYDHHKTDQHIKARASEGFNKTYGIVHPQEQWLSNRPIRLSPAYDRHVELGAEFFEAAGWERPYWYGTNEGLLGEDADLLRRYRNDIPVLLEGDVELARHRVTPEPK